MALSGCFSHTQILFQTYQRSLVLRGQHKLISEARSIASLRCLKTRFFGDCVPRVEPVRNALWSCSRGCGSAPRPGMDRRKRLRKRSTTCSCWMAGSQFASTAFTLGTVAVLPFYALMVFAPKAKITKTAMSSSLPYIVLGLVYAYLLYLSWTPDTIRAMFASKYWLPELPGILKMFSSEMTLASAWIHLLVVDLFAARHVYHDGLENGVETRHSVSLCLLVCPIGILSHTITKAMIKARVEENAQRH